MIAEQVTFWILAVIAMPTAIAMVLTKNPIHSALWLVVNFFATAILFLVLNAQFLAFVQILVYAGAIMVLFLFVIMMLNLTGGIERMQDKLAAQRVIAPLLALALFAEAAGVVYSGLFKIPAGNVPAAEFGKTYSVGQVLFTKYLFPFEVTSILLLVGMVGAVVLAKRRI